MLQTTWEYVLSKFEEAKVMLHPSDMEGLALAAALFGIVLLLIYLGKSIWGKKREGNEMPTRFMGWRVRRKFRDRKVANEELLRIGDEITERVEEAVEAGRLSREEADYWYKRIGVGANMPMLLPQALFKKPAEAEPTGKSSKHRINWLKNAIRIRRKNGHLAEDPRNVMAHQKTVEAVLAEQEVVKTKNGRKSKTK